MAVALKHVHGRKKLHLRSLAYCHFQFNEIEEICSHSLLIIGGVSRRRGSKSNHRSHARVQRVTPLDSEDRTIRRKLQRIVEHVQDRDAKQAADCIIPAMNKGKTVTKVPPKLQ